MDKTAAAIVAGMAFSLVAVVLLNMGLGTFRPDYADLIPAPDTIVWEEGDETVVWLSTNQDDIEIRIATVDLGVGDFHRIIPTSGQSMMLGRGEGCLAWAVTDLEVTGIVDASSGTPPGKQVSIQGEIDRGAATGTLKVYLRIYPFGGDLSDLEDVTGLRGYDEFEIDDSGTILYFNVPGTTDSFGSKRYRIPAQSGVWVFEASHDERFPRTARIATRGDIAHYDEEAWPPAMAEAEDVVISSDIGVGLVACSEADDVLVSLHDDQGVELKSYLVDVLADPQPAPTPQARPSNVNPVDVRVCVDSGDARANYLDGWEFVGGQLTADGDFGQSAGDIDTVTLTDSIEGSGYVYYFVGEITSDNVDNRENIQLRVSPAGAGNTAGLDSDRVYPITVTAIKSGSSNVSKDFGIWLDVHALSPNNNGRCP